MVEVLEIRRHARYVIVEPLLGSFGSAEVMIRNLGDRGAQLQHASPLRIGTRSRLWFRSGGVTVGVQAHVIWSHLSQVPDEHGKLLYQSGVEIDDNPDFLAALKALADHGVIRNDLNSLERKKKRLLEKEQEKSGKPTMKYVQREPDVPPDQALLIGHARERLRANPDEAQRYYDRAKTSGAEAVLVHRQDVVAVWEYLERTIDLPTIVKVFERSR
ncbi:MAG TPA: hypothetical protein VN181_07830 [Thermoanaerobaculia bacterium]|nr:hypothetical protein [Thermoanaerobaculia bacterium]